MRRCFNKTCTQQITGIGTHYILPISVSVQILQIVHLFQSSSISFIGMNGNIVGSAHIRGFLWLDGAPNMETLNWQDPYQINTTKSFFVKYVTTWNPRDNHDSHIHAHQSIEKNPFLLDTKDILSSNPFHDYEKFLNRFQRHTKCTENSCL